MAMDIIYKKTADLDEKNNFLIDLTSNNKIEQMYFKGKSKWLISGLELQIKSSSLKEVH